MGADGDYTKEHNALAWDLICSTMYKIHLDQCPENVDVCSPQGWVNGYLLPK